MMIKHFELNETGRDFVVGDIHGCFDQLKELMLEVDFNVKKDRIFSVGDLVDRGDKSEDCVKWLHKSWFHAVRGNHEQLAIDYFNKIYEAYGYIQNGGAWFVGLPEIEQACYVEIFDELPFAIDVQTKSGLVGIVHADCPVDDWRKLEQQLSGERADLFKDCCIWDRTRISTGCIADVAGIDRIFCGHTIQKSPSQLGNLHYIDTGAFLGRKLTMVEL